MIPRRKLLAGMALAGAMPVVTQAVAHGQAAEKNRGRALQGASFSAISSQLAEAKGFSKPVKAFARLEILEQAAMAEAFGTDPDAAVLGARHSALIRQLETAEGTEFDRLYVEAQILAHQELLAIHTQYAASGDDRMARGACLVSVAAIETHLAMLMTIRASVA
jgi:putative membrane protein